MPAWLPPLLGVESIAEGATLTLRGQPFVVRGGIPRSLALLDADQAQTGSAFAFKWQRRDTFESPASLARMRAWLEARYGALDQWLADAGEAPLLVDAGCGAGMSGLELLGDAATRVRYLGVDVSAAVDVARQRFAERGLPAAFIQADLGALPLAERSVDLMLSEGVLHHTPSTEQALKALVPLLRPGGRLLFYVYRRKGPIREFTDDHLRERLRAMAPEDAWRALEPLTRLGIALGELGASIEIPEPIDLLGIPAGRIDVQRLFYWHVAKAFYSPDLTFDEMHHINFDWYAPAYAHRQSPEEVRHWCAEAGLQIDREVVEDAGITIVARRHADPR